MSSDEPHPVRSADPPPKGEEEQQPSSTAAQPAATSKSPAAATNDNHQPQQETSTKTITTNAADPQAVEYKKRSPRRTHKRDPLEGKVLTPRELQEREQRWESRLLTDVVETAQAERFAKLQRLSSTDPTTTAVSPPSKQHTSQTIVQARKLASEWLSLRSGGKKKSNAASHSNHSQIDLPPFVISPVAARMFGSTEVPTKRSPRLAATTVRPSLCSGLTPRSRRVAATVAAPSSKR